MNLRWSSGAVSLQEPLDFKTFKIAIEGSVAQEDLVYAAFDGIATFPDRSYAWVSQAALRAWPGLKTDSRWQQGLDAMVRKAKPFGWIDEATGAIKAHVEWTGDTQAGC